MRIRPVWPVSMWKYSPCSIAFMLRASGAKPECDSIVSWNLPSRSTNSVNAKKSIQLFTSPLNAPSSRFLLKARRSVSFCGLDLARVAEVVDQQVAHLEAVAHLLAVHASEALQVVGRGRRLDQVALLLDRRELRCRPGRRSGAAARP
jgi:hypothetical protein